ncbi:MAG TPA: hypothetical protein VGM93_15755, partial [Acidimicrobiales bacterium]
MVDGWRVYPFTPGGGDVDPIARGRETGDLGKQKADEALARLSREVSDASVTEPPPVPESAGGQPEPSGNPGELPTAEPVSGAYTLPEGASGIATLRARLTTADRELARLAAAVGLDNTRAPDVVVGAAIGRIERAREGDILQGQLANVDALLGVPMHRADHATRLDTTRRIIDALNDARD